MVWATLKLKKSRPNELAHFLCVWLELFVVWLACAFASVAAHGRARLQPRLEDFFMGSRILFRSRSN